MGAAARRLGAASVVLLCLALSMRAAGARGEWAPETRSLSFPIRCGAVDIALDLTEPDDGDAFGRRYRHATLRAIRGGRTVGSIAVQNTSEPRMLRCRFRHDGSADIAIDRYDAAEFDGFVWRGRFAHVARIEPPRERMPTRVFSARRGDVTATVRQTGFTDGAYVRTSSYPRTNGVRIVRRGVVHDLTPLSDRAGQILEIRLVPTDATGEPSLFVYSDSGGNGCCEWMTVYRYDVSAGRYGLFTPSLYHLRGDWRPVPEPNLTTIFRSHFNIGSEAERGDAPLRYFAMDGARFDDVTPIEAVRVAEDARQALASLLASKPDPNDSDGRRGAEVRVRRYVGDLCEIGRCAEAWKRIGGVAFGWRIDLRQIRSELEWMTRYANG